MSVRIALLALALAFAPSATAANIATPRMDAIASWAAGKPVAVHCEDDWAQWHAMLAEFGLSTSLGGYTHVGGDVVYLGPSTCERLATGANSYRFGAAFHILLHEAQHARGVVNEAETECLSLKAVRAAALKFYRLKPNKPLIRTIVRDATEASKRRGPAYQTVC